VDSWKYLGFVPQHRRRLLLLSEKNKQTMFRIFCWLKLNFGFYLKKTFDCLFYFFLNKHNFYSLPRRWKGKNIKFTATPQLTACFMTFFVPFKAGSINSFRGSSTLDGKGLAQWMTMLIQKTKQKWQCACGSRKKKTKHS
jgi:hypothetical protein